MTIIYIRPMRRMRYGRKVLRGICKLEAIVDLRAAEPETEAEVGGSRIGRYRNRDR